MFNNSCNTQEISPAGHDPGITTNMFVNLLILSCLVLSRHIKHIRQRRKLRKPQMTHKCYDLIKNYITTKGAQMEHLFLHFCNKIVKTGSPKSLSGMDFPPEHKNRGLSGDCNEDEETIFLQKF